MNQSCDSHAGSVRIKPPRAALLLLAALAVSFVVMAASSSPARAATFEVTNTNDSGEGSLRQAITDASFGDTIEISATGTVELESALPELSTDIKIVGPGADQFTVKRSEASGTDNFRIFTVGNGATVFISGLTVTNGVAACCSDDGGGIANLGGTLTVRDSTITENAVEARAIYGSGGGIYNENGSMLTVEGSTISGNTAEEDYDGSASTGGGITNRGTLTVRDSTISGNTAEVGGGIYSFTGSSEKTTITNSTIAGNSADLAGGGVYNANVDGLTVIEYSTITFNTAPEGEGGGVASDGVWDTITRASSSIIVGNTNSDVDSVNLNGDTANNTFVSGGHNLIGDGVSARQAFGTDSPTLADNGGPTQTIALQDGAEAIDAASDNFPDTDQRGVERPQREGPDIGSFEFQSESNPTPDPDLDPEPKPDPEPDPTPEPDPAELGASPKRVAFGRVAVGSRKLRNVVLKNPGSEGSGNIKVSSVSVSGNSEFSTPFKGNITLELGQERTFRVYFDPKRTGLKQGTLVIQHDGDNDALRVPLVGRGVPNQRGCTIVGTPGQEVIRGTQGRDVICAGRGNHTIRGLNGNDTIYGGPGRDRLFGQGGNDRLLGGGGLDQLIGGSGVDKLYGQGGNDFLNVRDRKSKDVANGGAGSDRCVADRGDRRISCER